MPKLGHARMPCQGLWVQHPERQAEYCTPAQLRWALTQSQSKRKAGRSISGLKDTIEWVVVAALRWGTAAQRALNADSVGDKGSALTTAWHAWRWPKAVGKETVAGM